MTTRRHLAAGFALGTVLSACTVGPDYQPPTPPVGADGPLQSADKAVDIAAEMPDDWWRLYNDPYLDQLLRESFAANADLSAAEANLSAARALLDAARAGRYPTTKADVGGIFGRDATTDQILEIGGHEPTTTWLFDDILDASYELDLFGRVRRSIEAAKADAEAASAGRDALKITVAAETARAYGQICTLGAQLAVARHSLEVVARETEITVQRHDAGGNSHFDVVRSQGLVAQVRAEIPPLEGQRRAAFFQLAALLGRTPAKAPNEALACISPPRLSALIPIGDGAALLKRRPDIRQADRNLAAATARIGVATADLYPKISLNGLFGGASTDIASLASGRALTWGVGPSVSWAFPIQAGPRARVRQAEAGTAAALAAFDSTVLQALKDTEAALATYSAELDRRQALGEAQQRDHEAFDLAHDAFLAGSLSNLDLLTTEQTLVAADAAVAASDAALVQDQISIFKALGGGWESPAPSSDDG
jgi:NodT family efflux transporter outer membrane factor (OMF) lipoprotein